MVNRQTQPPARQVVLLGASNLTRGISTIIGTSQRMYGQPLRILTAMGFGRSYGQPSTVLFRTLPGILQCGLWDTLNSGQSLPTTALVTDIGNDLMYGVEITQILQWVDEAIGRLQQAGAQVSLTLLPMDSINRLSARRFNFFRRMLFPSCGLEFADARDRATKLHDQLEKLAAARGIRAVPQRGLWYGIDPIHIQLRHWQSAWGEVLSTWGETGEISTVKAPQSLRRWLYLRTRAPLNRALFGREQSKSQPSARLPDGTTISFY